MILKLPRRFMEDCISCDCDVGDTIKWTKTHITLECTPEQIDEIRSRADYYRTEYPYMDRGMFGLGRSAVATLKSLDKQTG